MELRRVRISEPDVDVLRSGLAEEYQSRYGDGDEMSTVPDSDFDPPTGLFLVALEAGEVVAGGGPLSTRDAAMPAYPSTAATPRPSPSRSTWRR